MVCIAQCGQDDSYSHCHPGISPLAIYKVLIQFLIPCYRNNTQSQSGQIYHKYANHSRQQVIQKLHSLTGIGCQQIQKHIDCYNGLSEKIKQNQLKSSKENKGKQYPYYLSGFPAQRHHHPIYRYRQNNITYTYQ